jgi:hypothetical protein
VSVVPIEPHAASVLKRMKHEMELLLRRMFGRTGTTTPCLYGPSLLAETPWTPSIDALQDGTPVIKAD